MRTSDTFFVIQNARQDDDGKLRIVGQYILNGTTEVVSTPSSSPEDNQPLVNIEIARLFEAKWILPPRESKAYRPVKDFAESMEYETVEHEDFTYPER
jgi:hypothetical protein